MHSKLGKESVILSVKQIVLEITFNFGDVPDSRGTLTFDRPKIIVQDQILKGFDHWATKYAM